MDQDTTRATVAQLFEAYERRDLDRVASLIDDDIDWIIHAPLHIFPFAGHRRGKRAVLEALDGILQDYKVEHYVPQLLIADGEWAAALSDTAFRQRSTGRVLSFHISNFLRVRNGRVIEFREFTNTFDVIEQALGRTLVV